MARRLVYLLIGVAILFLILVGISIFTFLPMITSAHSSQTTPTATTVTTPTTPSTTATPKSGNGAAKALKQYAPNIKSQIAQGLKMTPDALTTQLKAGKTLDAIAIAQGVSTTQLQTIISNALQTSLQPAVDDGTITQKQLTNLAKRYANKPALLDKMLLRAA